MLVVHETTKRISNGCHNLTEFPRTCQKHAGEPFCKEPNELWMQLALCNAECECGHTWTVAAHALKRYGGAPQITLIGLSRHAIGFTKKPLGAANDSFFFAWSRAASKTTQASSWKSGRFPRHDLACISACDPGDAPRRIENGTDARFPSYHQLCQLRDDMQNCLDTCLSTSNSRHNAWRGRYQDEGIFVSNGTKDEDHCMD